VSGDLPDEQASEECVQQLAQAFELSGDDDNLRFADLVADECNVLLENLRFLFESLGRGGKKSFAIEQSVDPTTVSRWLNGSYEPHASAVAQIVAYFGLHPLTDLRRDPVFLSAEPIAMSDRRKWLHGRVDALSLDDLRELYPALHRLLKEPSND
jgi:hypothetical protein